MKPFDRKIVLENGREFCGYGFGADREQMGEIVFNTSMVGYQEILSDPSYTDQTVVMTLSLIHISRPVEEMRESKPRDPKLMRMGVMTALAIGIHNFPEGIATFTAAAENLTLGVAIAVAIAIHNIPEGIAVSIPIYYATGDRGKAFRLSLLSGLAEPVGALLAYLVLMPLMSPTLMGCILAAVAGIMVYISIDELLPAAREYGEAHIAIYGVVAGMALMALSLIMLA